MRSRLRSRVSSSLAIPDITRSLKRQPYHYNGWFLGVLCAGFIFADGTLTALGSVSREAYRNHLYTAALLTYLAVLLCILVVDWRGFLTLHGHVEWRSISWPARIGIALVYILLWILFFVMPGLYLGFAIKDTFAAWRRRPFEMKLRTAELEAELGMAPPTEGTCKACGKPLQVGAEYCEFCGARVVAHPRVCPVCATIAQPNARFCPKCRAPLVSRQDT